MPNTTALMRDSPSASTSKAPGTPAAPLVSITALWIWACTLAEITLRASAPPPPMAALRLLPADTATEAPSTTAKISACWVALTTTWPPAVATLLPDIVASTVLKILLTATLVPTAIATPPAPACTATAPPTAMAVMLAVSEALTRTPEPFRRSCASSTLARTTVAIWLMATETPMEAPAPTPPAETARPRAPATVTMRLLFSALTRTSP